MVETIKESKKSIIFKSIGIISFTVIVNILITINIGQKPNNWIQLGINAVAMMVLSTIFTYKRYSVERKQGLIPVDNTGIPLLSPEHYHNEHVYWIEPYQTKLTIYFTGVKHITRKDLVFFTKDTTGRINLAMLEEDLLKILPKLKNGQYTGTFNVSVYKKYTVLIPVEPKKEI